NDALFGDERQCIRGLQSPPRSSDPDGGGPAERRGTGRNGSPEKPVGALAGRASRPERPGARDAHACRHFAESTIPPQQLSWQEPGSRVRYNRALPPRLMSLILKLRGARAVSSFRLDKLNSRLA